MVIVPKQKFQSKLTMTQKNLRSKEEPCLLFERFLA